MLARLKRPCLRAKSRLPPACTPRDINICRFSATTDHLLTLHTCKAVSALTTKTSKILPHLSPHVNYSPCHLNASLLSSLLCCLHTIFRGGVMIEQARRPSRVTGIVGAFWQKLWGDERCKMQTHPAGRLQTPVDVIMVWPLYPHLLRCQGWS